MIGLVLVTHGRLAEEFVHALEHIVGRQEMVAAVSIGPEDKMEVRRADIAAAVKSVDSGEGVIILTDMFGGTPSNLAISLLEEGRVEVVAGLNLPMLVKLVRVRKDSNLHKCAAAAQDAGRKYINIASQILGGLMAALVRELEIVNERGLHARASAKFVKCAEGFDANIVVTRDGHTVPATSIMGLMMLAAAMGTSISVEASGPEADAAMAALAALVESKFDED